VADSLLGDVDTPESLHRYMYGLNNPVAFVDPSGHWSLFKAVGSAVSGAVKSVGGAVKTAVSKATTAVKSAATWVNNTVVKPVVSAVKSAATWVNNNVLKPVVSAVKSFGSSVNNNVLKPAVAAAGRGVAAVGQGIAAVGRGVAAAADAAGQALRSTASYVQARTEELKQKVVEFACTTADKLGDAWESVKGWAADVDWAKVGRVTLLVGGLVVGAALTVATAGAAGPVTAGLLYGALALDVVFTASDVGEELTGTNVVKDTVFGGNDLVYGAVSIGVGFVGGVGPNDAAKLVKLPGVVDAAGDAAQGVRKVDDLVPVGSKAGSPCSFAGDTGVVLADGGMKRISDVVVGDRVAGWDVVEGRGTVGIVEGTWVHGDGLVDVSFTGGGVVESTADHPWWSVSVGGWVRADHLVVDDELLAGDGSVVTVESVVDGGVVDAAFNLTVSGTHTYLVGPPSKTRAGLAGGVLVHNCPTPPASSGAVPGPNNALRDPATGRFVENPGSAATAARNAPPSATVNGNSRLSPREATVYARYDSDGKFLKFGVTQDTAKRYSKPKLAGGRLRDVAKGSRSDMLDLERKLVEQSGGPLNREPWSASRRGQP
jgi:hypothetical protein